MYLKKNKITFKLISKFLLILTMLVDDIRNLISQYINELILLFVIYHDNFLEKKPIFDIRLHL